MVVNDVKHAYALFAASDGDLHFHSSCSRTISKFLFPRQV